MSLGAQTPFAQCQYLRRDLLPLASTSPQTPLELPLTILARRKQEPKRGRGLKLELDIRADLYLADW